MQMLRSCVRSVWMVAALAVCVTTPAAAQWRGKYAPVETASLREKLEHLALGADVEAIALGLVDAYDDQYRKLDAGQARLSQWFQSRMVPVEGSSRRIAEAFNSEYYAVHQARLRITTELADTLFADLQMFLPQHGVVVDRLERAARRRRVLDAHNFSTSPAGSEAMFDALAWAEQEVRDTALIEDIRVATNDEAVRADALLAEYERAMPDRAMVFLRILNAFKIETDMKVREALGKELRDMLRALQTDAEAIAVPMCAIADTIASLLPADLAKKLARERIRQTRGWLDGYRFEADFALVRSRLSDADVALGAALDSLEDRYLRAKDDAGARLRDDYRRFAEDDWWVDARVYDTGEDGDDVSSAMYQELYNTYRAASAFWTERLAAFERELAHLAGDRLGVSQ